MRTKEKLLLFLEENRGAYFSGEEIAKNLSVTRAAVWKAANSLRGEGYGIDAVPNKGYCLSADTDILSSQGIRKYLEGRWKTMKLEVLPSAPSTNALLREQAESGAEEGWAVIAGGQTAGRGRMGRRFYSPAGTGIYMSLLLRPEGWTPDKAVRLTTMAAVAACEAIEEVSGGQAKIKWVNDIYMEERKVGGILTEASYSLETGFLDYAVMGIGLNLYPPEKGFPPELAGIAGTIFPKGQRDGKNCLAAGLLNHFMKYYTERESSGYEEQYRARSFVIGRRIWVLSPKGKKSGTALDVDKDCRLQIQYENGESELLSAGEIGICPEPALGVGETF